ncbi:MAG: hypothetical protein ACYDEH_07830 [Acidimicrobiales bacterium]
MGSRAKRVSTRLAVQLLAVGLLVVGAVTPAVAARPGHGGSGSGGGGTGSTTSGADVSYPQCGTTLPSFAFGIVGVNDGLANDLNPCLGPSPSYPSYTQSELYWAVTASTGGTTQPNVSLYVNTADPGNMYNGKPIADWPTNGGNTQYGSCTTTTVTSRGHTYTVGANSDACAWQYGYNKAAQDAAWLTDAADAINGQQSTTVVPDTPSSYPWWLDVETGNTWQSDTTMNVADLQGMVAGLQAAGVTTANAIGAYSTASQWNSITGGTTSLASGSLYGIPNWIPGATTQVQAVSNCSLASFTGGSVMVTQWTGSPDNDWACLPA